MNEEFYINALIDEISGRISNEDKVLLQEWRAASPDSDALEKNVRTIWELSDTYKHDLAIDQEKEWDLLQNKISKSQTRRIPAIWYGIAALLVLSFSLWILIFQKDRIIHFEATADNEKIVLDDGSIILLSRESTIDFPENFKGNRTVSMTGQALMTIARDPNRPFVVNTPDMLLEVLGTQFFISDSDNDLSGEIQLIEGKIIVSAKHKIENPITMKAGERVIFEASETTLSSALNTQIYKWHPTEFDFKNKALTDVIRKISEYFGITITLNEQLKSCTFTGNLNSLNSEDMLKNISKVYSAQLKNENGVFYILNGSCQ